MRNVPKSSKTYNSNILNGQFLLNIIIDLLAIRCHISLSSSINYLHFTKLIFKIASEIAEMFNQISKKQKNKINVK